jgi:urease accessory protein
VLEPFSREREARASPAARRSPLHWTARSGVRSGTANRRTDIGWHGHLWLRYTRDHDRTTALDRHEGPLRVLQRLYPEGPAVCHHVLVHPPGGIVGGDVLEVDAHLADGAHAFVTTAGATRFYRSGGATARQRVAARLDAGARLEWLPLETIAYGGCRADNEQRFHLAAGAEMIGWDLLALGLPAAGDDFERGRYRQHLELPGAWIERGVIDGADTRLLASPLGLDGQRLLATLWFAAGAPIAPPRRDALLDAARESCAAHPLARRAGATAPHPRVVVLRVLAPRVEPALALLQAVWARWRPLAWGLAPQPPRVWRT